ncbi:MAG: flagellar basal body rod protein FlgC [Acidimicrobiales bacterium]
MFGALSISGSGAEAMQTWIDTSAGNIANMDDQAAVGTPAYGAQTPFLTPVATGGEGEGVEVSRVDVGTTKGVVTFQPTSTLASAQGYVVVPNVDLADQMVGMIEAQEGYQADTVMMEKAQSAYAAGLTIGT